jgi:peroxiredoxin
MIEDLRTMDEWRRRWRTPPTLLLAGSMVLATAIATGGQEAPVPLPDVQTLGPQVGSRVPDFSLPDQNGRTRTIASLTGPKGLLLLFYRSADWCPYCKAQLVELQARSGDLRKAGIGIAAVSYDPVPVLADFSKRRGITFPLLSDVGSTTIKAYGLFNTTIAVTDTRSYGIPFPGTFLLSPQQIVTSRQFEQAYQERITVGSILAHMGAGIDVPVAAVSAPGAKISSFATSTAVAVGNHFSIAVDVVPNPGVHVYAPGVAGYQPIALTIAPQVGLVLRTAQYPRAEDYHFKPLNEHVSVYQHPFRILQDVMIDPSPAAQAALKDMPAMTIRGTLNYQACDDRLCFAPRSVPLTWTITLQPLDRVRATP